MQQHGNTTFRSYALHLPLLRGFPQAVFLYVVTDKHVAGTLAGAHGLAL